MKILYKRLTAAGLVVVLGMTGMAVMNTAGCGSSGEGVSSTETREDAADEAYRSAPADLTLWYADDSYTDFFTEAAARYYAKTGKKVAVQYQDTIDYLGTIYDKTMQDDAFPDVYLLPGDNLEEAYLYGLVSVNQTDPSGSGVVEKAVEAAAYEDRVLGYPLSYDACVFIYQTDYFTEAPASLQAIIDYSNENEPAENVEYLLEWDVKDAFYDFPFVGNSVTFAKSGSDELNVTYDDTLYQQDLEYFDTILASFSIDADQVSEQHIVNNFREGRTLSAILDTDTLWQLDGYDYGLMQMPELSDTLSAATCASTDMIVVNDYTKDSAAAADFAQFVTVDMSDELHGLSGHYSVIPSETPDTVEQTALDAYDAAVLMPDSKDAKNFWVTLEETILKYF
mgnify:FL=1